MRGKLILIEGRDGAGKSTQVDLLREYLESQGVETEHIHFPNYDSPTGKVILEMLKGETVLFSREGYRKYTRFLSPSRLWEERMVDVDKNRHPQHAAMLQALFAVNRYEVMAQIRVALAAGKTLLLDRYYHSSLAYGQAQGIDLPWLAAINSEAARPDLAIYLNISHEESLTRRPDRRDAFEKDRELQGNLDRFYAQYWGYQGTGQGYVILDGMQDPMAIHRKIVTLVEGQPSETQASEAVI